MKRTRTLEKRGLDFADAALLFEGLVYTVEDTRFDYPEQRFQTFGVLNARLMMVVWIEAEGGRRILSMRKCNERERAKIGPRLG